MSKNNQVGLALGKTGGDLIEYWRRGNIPADLKDLEQLARELVKRDGLRSGKEIEKFLERGDHPKPSILSNELFPQPIDMDSHLTYKRLRMSAERQISADGLVTSIHQIEIQAIADFPLPSIRHRRMANESKFEDLELKFIPGHRDGFGNMRGRVLSKSEKLLVWTVEFDPPLLKNQKASYSHIQSCSGIHAMTYEQCHEQFVAGHSRGKFEYWRIKMLAPTQQLHMKLEFPPNYPIAFPSSDGFNVYSDATEHPNEITRLRNGHCFSKNFNEQTKQWTLELNVPYAAIGLGYQLQWIPPEASSFKAEV